MPRADEFAVVGTLLDVALGLCRLQTAGTNSRIARCVSRVSSVRGDIRLRFQCDGEHAFAARREMRAQFGGKSRVGGVRFAGKTC